MRKQRRRPFETFGLSFLDVVSCSFGAIIILLVIVKITQPFTLEMLSVDLSGHVQELELQLAQIKGQTSTLKRELKSSQQQLSRNKSNLARLQGNLTDIKAQHETAQIDQKVSKVVEGKLKSAKQELSEEMQRLLGENYQRPKSDATIGGVPVDSEYIIFIIDTSGSMQQYACSLLPKIISEVLRIYPRVKGIQVMNDMGTYMFSQYRDRWIPDSPARRNAILKRLGNWFPFSNSSPAEGIKTAIRTFYDKGKNISLYVFGDDFSGSSIQSVVNDVLRLNRNNSNKRRRVRIHTVGFPVLFAAKQGDPVRMSALMRTLAEQNAGSFVGLNNRLKPCF